MNLEAGQRVDSRYVVGRAIGRGGMAVVYQARDLRLEVDVALKVLTLASEGIRARLQREGRIQAALRHPNVVPVTDIVEVDGQLGLVMELVNGPSLDQLLRAVTLAPGEPVELLRGALAGIRAAHDMGLVHRDLKPANILVSVSAEGLVPKVADFGLARLVDGDTRWTRSGVAMGTPRYMAPEQIRDSAAVDQRADLFAFGVIAYEVCCGQPPFVGADTWEVFNAIMAGDYPPPTDLPEPLAELIGRCLQGDPSDRPQSAAEVLRALDEAGGAAFTGWRPSTVAGARALSSHLTPVEDEAAVQTLERDASTLPPPVEAVSSVAAPGAAQAAPEREPRRWGALAAGALGVGCLVAAAVVSWPTTPSGWVSVRSLQPGDRISADDLKPAAVDEALRDQVLADRHEAEGRTVALPIEAGQALHRGRLAAPSAGKGIEALLDDGQALVTLPLAGASVGLGLRPGQRVDLHHTRAGPDGRDETQLLFSGAEVLRVDAEPDTAAFRVSWNASEKLTQAKVEGAFSLALLPETVPPEQAGAEAVDLVPGSVPVALRPLWPRHRIGSGDVAGPGSESLVDGLVGTLRLPGEPVTEEHLADPERGRHPGALVRPGHVLFSVPMEPGLGRLLAPGGEVNLLTSVELDGERLTVHLLQRVTVVSVTGEPAPCPCALVAVEADVAPRVAHALATGPVSASIVPPSE